MSNLNEMSYLQVFKEILFGAIMLHVTHQMTQNTRMEEVTHINLANKLKKTILYGENTLPVISEHAFMNTKISFLKTCWSGLHANNLFYMPLTF